MNRMFVINFYIYIVILYLCFIASLTVYTQKGQPLYLRLFPVFLLITLGVEIASHILVRSFKDNSFLYHIFFPLEFTFYLYIAYKILSKKKLKKAILVSTLFYLITIGVSYLFFEVGNFPTLAYCGGAFLVVFFYLFYFFELVDYPITLTPKRDPAFWIFLGVTIYYSGSLPVWATTNLITGFSQGTLEYLSTLVMLLNYALYISFIVAFICKGIFKKKNLRAINYDEIAEFLTPEQKNALFK